MTIANGAGRPPTAAARYTGVLTAWAVSRAIVVAGLLVGASLGKNRSVWGGFVAWDGRWYLQAARSGYGGRPVTGVESPWPFFPLLPGLLEAVAAVRLPDAAVVVIANQLLLLAAMVGLTRLVERRVGAEPARRAVWVLAVFPMSGVFSMLYPSSVFLAASIWAFEFAERKRWAWSGAVAAAATMVRPNGLLVVAVLAVAVFADAGSDAGAVDGRRRRSALLVVAPSAVALAAWLMVCAVRTGNPLVFVTAKGAWREHRLVEAVWLVATQPGLKQIAVHTGFGVLAVAALWFSWRRLPRSWRALAVLTIGLPMVTGVVGLGRYVNECFPLMVAGGLVLGAAPARVRRPLLACSAAALFVAAASMADYQLLP